MNQPTRKTAFKLLLTVAMTLGLSIALQSALAQVAWTNPTCSPPGCNVPPPINVGTTTAAYTSAGQEVRSSLYVAASSTMTGLNFFGVAGKMVINPAANYGGGALFVDNAAPYYKVAIGASSSLPAKFTIEMSDDGAIEGLHIQRKSNTAGSFSYLNIKDEANNNVFQVNQSGNVGIGANNPVQKLDVRGNIYMPTGNYLTWNNGDATIGAVAGYNLQFSTYNGAALTEKMRIMSDGRVGIGTNNPQATLDVYNPSVVPYSKSAILAYGIGDGNFNLAAKKGVATNNSGDIFSKLSLDYQTTENASINFHRGGGSIGGFMSFATNNGTERMRIDGSGNVGIGEPSPSYKLDVRGGISADTIRLKMNGSGSGQVLMNTGNGDATWVATSSLGLNGGGSTYCLLSKNDNQPTNPFMGSSAPVNWTVEDYDPSGCHSGTGADIIIPAGINFINIVTNVHFAAGSDTRYVRILKNGAIIVWHAYYNQPAGNTSNGLVSSGWLRVVPGDVFQVHAHSYSSNPNLDGVRTWFRAEMRN